MTNQLSAAEMQELKRRARAQRRRHAFWMWAALFGSVVFGVLLLAIGSVVWSSLGERRPFSIEGDVIFLPVLAVALLAVLIPRRTKAPEDKIGMVMAERQDRRVLRVIGLHAALGLAAAAQFAIQPDDFSLIVVAPPLMVAGVLLERYRRSPDDVVRLAAAQALSAGFLGAFVVLTGLSLTAWLSLELAGRLSPLALAAMTAVTAGAFVFHSLRPGKA